MIISFSGLGGSGKSTQIKNIVEKLSNKKNKNKVIVLRDKFLWPKIANLFNKKTKKQKNIETKKKSNINFLQRLKLVIRSFFYFFDSWRIYFFSILLDSKNNLVIYDRYMYDFFIELNFPQKRLTSFNKFLMKFLPKPDIMFYFDISPEVSIKRKFEMEKEALTIYHNLYHEVFSLGESIIINAEKNKEKITENIINIIIDSRGTDKFFKNYYSYILYQFLVNNKTNYLKDEVLKIDYYKLIVLAIKNRILWLFANRIKQLGIKTNCENQIEKILIEGGRILNKKEKTIIFLDELKKITKVDFSIIKEAEDVEIGTDIDLVFKNKDNFEKYISYISNNAKVERISSVKVDVKIKELIDMDLHLGIYYHNLEYVENDFLWNNPNEANVLTTISHSFNELTLITVGDIYKIKKLDNGIDWKLAFNEAKKLSWSHSLQFWMKIYDHPSEISYSFPYKIPFPTLLIMKFNKYLANFQLDMFEDFVNLIKAIRARRMGKIPWHDGWFKN